jgi:hypothetical protein
MHFDQSRSSTNRASTITLGCSLKPRRPQVSIVNQPSKYDHRPSRACVRSHPRGRTSDSDAAASLDRQPTEQVRSRGRRDTTRSTSHDRQPSTNRASTKYDHARWCTRIPASRCLDRQPTEQVRSQPSLHTPPTCASDSLSRSSTNRASTITPLPAARSSTKLITCLDRQPTEQVRSHDELGPTETLGLSRSSTDQASTITCAASRREARRRSLGRQLTEQVRSRAPFVRVDGEASRSRSSTDRASTITTSTGKMTAAGSGSRSSTNQASTITPSWLARRAGIECLGRQPSTNRASTITRSRTKNALP